MNFKFLSSLFILGVLLVSCKSAKVAEESSPNKRDLKGTWEITDIRFIGEEGLYKAKILDVADTRCFRGSQWVFIPNNGTGRFTLTPSDRCPQSSHRILWSFFNNPDKTTDFQFKYVDDKNRRLSESKSGYRLMIADLNPQQMELRIPTLDQQGNPFEIVLLYSKLSDEINL